MSRLSDPAEDWVEILKLYGGRCWICGALWEHKDHYVASSSSTRSSVTNPERVRVVCATHPSSSSFSLTRSLNRTSTNCDYETRSTVRVPQTPWNGLRDTSGKSDPLALT